MTHHHHKKDAATLFKERSLNAIERRRKMEKWLKAALIIVALAMLLLTLYVYRFA